MIMHLEENHIRKERKFSFMPITTNQSRKCTLFKKNSSGVTQKNEKLLETQFKKS